MDNKKMKEDLRWLIKEWEYLSEEQKKKIMWRVRLDRLQRLAIQTIPILFLITLVQFVIWLLIR